MELGLKPTTLWPVDLRLEHLHSLWLSRVSVSFARPALQLGLVVLGGAQKIKSEELSSCRQSWTILTLLSPSMPGLQSS